MAYMQVPGSGTLVSGAHQRQATSAYAPRPCIHTRGWHPVAMWDITHPKHRHPTHGGALTPQQETADPTSAAMAELVHEADVLTKELVTGPFGQAGLERRKVLCDSGLPDAEMCELIEPVPSTTPVQEAFSRGKWLLGLLILQSTSSFILDSYSDLLKEHLVVVMFLTMLVGAGGNAGNQSAIKVIRGLATGTMLPSWQSARNILLEQAAVGLLLGTGLSVGGFIRVYLWNGNVLNAFSIALSLFCIVLTSVILGTGLPLALTKVGVDPANAGTSIQVIMDVLGVLITCVTCTFVLEQLAHMV